MYRGINKYRKKEETIVGPKIWKHSQFVYFPCFEITLVLHQSLPCLFSQAFLCVSHQPLGGVGEAMKWPLLTSLSPHGPQYSNNMSNRHFLSVWKSKYRSLVWLGCGGKRLRHWRRVSATKCVVFLFYVKVQSLTLKVYEKEPENMTGIYIIVGQLRVVLWITLHSLRLHCTVVYTFT